MLLHHFEAWTKVIFVNWQNEKIQKLKKREKRKGELLSSKKICGNSGDKIFFFETIPADYEVDSIELYVVKFVSYLQ